MRTLHPGVMAIPLLALTMALLVLAWSEFTALQPRRSGMTIAGMAAPDGRSFLLPAVLVDQGDDAMTDDDAADDNAAPDQQQN